MKRLFYKFGILSFFLFNLITEKALLQSHDHIPTWYHSEYTISSFFINQVPSKMSIVLVSDEETVRRYQSCVRTVSAWLEYFCALNAGYGKTILFGSSEHDLRPVHYGVATVQYLGSVHIITRAHITGYSSLVLIAGNRPVDLYVTCTHICTTRLAAAYVAVPEGAACCTQKSRWTTRAYTASTNRWLPVCGYCSSSSWVYASLEHSFLQARGYSTTMIATDQSPAFRFVAKIPVL
jgi:hypothetical protein